MPSFKEWTVYGKVFRKGAPAADGPIAVKEITANDASTPVNAPLAVSLMQQLVALIPQDILYPKPNGKIFEQILALLPVKLTEEGSHKDSTETLSVDAQLKTIAAKVKMLEELTDRLLRNSLAITADKGTIMKALSQPGCEGLRFYQCVSGNSTEKPEMLSFVMLGVDKESNDLGYDFNISFKKEIEKIMTTSFSAEYNKAIGSIDFLDLSDKNELLQPYVLLKYALNASDRPEAQTYSSKA